MNEEEEEEAMWQSSPKKLISNLATKARKRLTVRAVAPPLIMVKRARTPEIEKGVDVDRRSSDDEDEESMWHRPLNRVWLPVSPLPVEPAQNPWRDFGDRCIPFQGVGKVTFKEDGHKYHLQDDFGAYPDFIISGSGLVDYWESVCKVKPENEINPLVAATNILRKKQESRNSSPPEVSRLNTEGERVYEVREMLTRYFNKFLETWPKDYPTFIERTADFVECTPDKRSKSNYTQHVRHRVIGMIEDWLYGCRDTLKVDECYDSDMVTILRYLMVDGSFGHVTAERASGEALSVALSEEYDRLIARGHADYLESPISKWELASVPRTIPSQWGTVLHAHIECRLRPEVGTPPDMREVEDHAQVDAFLHHLKVTGADVAAVEMALGSRLYKICGTLDMLVRLPDGRFKLWDFKRVPSGAMWLEMNEKTNDPYAVNAKYAFSDTFVSYAIQLAAYRKLLSLDHPEMVVVPEATLAAFHPTAHTFCLVHVQLDAPFRSDTLVTMKGVADRWVDGEKVVNVTPLSPILYIEALFEKRLEHLRLHFHT